MLVSIIYDMFNKKENQLLDYYVSHKSNHVVVDASHFVKMYERDPLSVKGAVILPPHIGSEDFGRFSIPISQDADLVLTDEQ